MKTREELIKEVTVDFWCKFVYTTDKNDILQVSGSMYHGHLTISINE